MKAILYNDDNNQFCIIFPNYNECTSDAEKEIVLQNIINKDLPKNPDGSMRQYFIKEYNELFIFFYKWINKILIRFKT